MIRISVLLNERTPPNLFDLISQGINLFREYSKTEANAYQEDIDYLLLSRSIAIILISSNQSLVASGRLQALIHGRSRRANAAIGLAFASLPPSQIPSGSKTSSEWIPIFPDMPSTMEVIVQSRIYGAMSLKSLSHLVWEDLDLSTRVQVGFSEARKKSFFNAVEILEPLARDVETCYGKPSQELLLFGIVLVNCYNAVGREVDGEKFGRYIWSNMYRSWIPNISVGSTKQSYLRIALSDSFLGQGDYIEAKALLAQVLHFSSIDSNLFMSATLRLLKISRREKEPSSLLEDWARLGRGVKLFNNLADVLKHECIEETVRAFTRAFALSPKMPSKSGNILPSALEKYSNIRPQLYSIFCTHFLISTLTLRI